MHINRFMGSHIDDMARQDRFSVEIHGPAGIRSRGIRCTNIEMPGKQIITQEFSEYGGGPMRKYPSKVDYGGGAIALTFMMDTTFEDKQKIELWQSYVHDEAFGFQYPEDYWGEIKIQQEGRDGNSIYEVVLHEAWPQSIDTQALDSSASSTIQTFSASFVYRTWSSSYENSPSGLLGGLFKKFSRKIKTKASSKIEGKIFG